MRKLKVKITKKAVNLEMVTAKDLMRYSLVINRIQIKNSIHFVSKLNMIT